MPSAPWSQTPNVGDGILDRSSEQSGIARTCVSFRKRKTLPRNTLDYTHFDLNYIPASNVALGFEADPFGSAVFCPVAEEGNIL